MQELKAVQLHFLPRPSWLVNLPMLQETENQEVQNLNLFDILERMCSAFSQACQEKCSCTCAMYKMFAIGYFDSSMVFSFDIALMTLQLAYMGGCIKHCKEGIWYKKEEEVQKMCPRHL